MDLLTSTYTLSLLGWCLTVPVLGPVTAWGSYYARRSSRESASSWAAACAKKYSTGDVTSAAYLSGGNQSFGMQDFVDTLGLLFIQRRSSLDFGSQGLHAYTSCPSQCRDVDEIRN